MKSHQKSTLVTAFSENAVVNVFFFKFSESCKTWIQLPQRLYSGTCWEQDQSKDEREEQLMAASILPAEGPSGGTLYLTLKPDVTAERGDWKINFRLEINKTPVFLFHAAEFRKGALSTFSTHLKMMKSLKYFLLQTPYQPLVQNIVTERCEGAGGDALYLINLSMPVQISFGGAAKDKRPLNLTAAFVWMFWDL